MCQKSNTWNYSNKKLHTFFPLTQPYMRNDHLPQWSLREFLLWYDVKDNWDIFLLLVLLHSLNSITLRQKRWKLLEEVCNSNNIEHDTAIETCQYLSRFKCKRFEFFPKKVKFLNLKSIDLCPMARLTKEEILCMVGVGRYSWKSQVTAPNTPCSGSWKS